MDYFAPILKRILALHRDIADITDVSQQVIKQSDSVSAMQEDFMTKLAALDKANKEAYQAGVKWGAEQTRLGADISRLQGMPAIAERSADLATMAQFERDVARQVIIEAAISLGQLDPGLYSMLFKELSTYDDWPAKRPALVEAITKSPGG